MVAAAVWPGYLAIGSSESVWYLRYRSVLILGGLGLRRFLLLVGDILCFIEPCEFYHERSCDKFPTKGTAGEAGPRTRDALSSLYLFR